MHPPLPPLPWLRAFEAAARLGNFTRAADELALTPAAISHQIRALEGHLGATLFLRGNRRISLTRLGESYLPAVRNAFAELSLATADVFGRAEQTTLKIRCLQSFAQAWLVPRLPSFQRAHPGIRLQLHTAAWAGSLEAEQLDLDIFYGDASLTAGGAEQLLAGQVLPLAAPDLAQDCGDLAELAQAPLIEIAGASESWPRFFARQQLTPDLPPPVMVVDQSSIALDLAAAGLGHCLVFEAFAADHLRTGRLVPSLRAAYREDQGMYLKRGSGAGHPTPDLDAFISWLRRTAQG